MIVLERAWAVVLGLSLLPFTVWAAVRLLGTERGAPWMQLMSFTPYVAGVALLPLAAAVVSRRWGLALVAAALAVVLAGCVLPRAVATPSAGRTGGGAGTPLRMVTANLLFGGAEPRTVVDLVRDHDVDVLAVQELTPDAVQALDDAGLATLLPHRRVDARPGGSGSGLFSRYPLRDTGVRRMPAGHVQSYGTLLVPGAGPVLIESAHPAAPSDAAGARQWAEEISLQPAATPTGPLRILLGDFNSTLDHEGLRRLVGTGYRDAADTAGAGLRPTWSPGIFGGLAEWVPPVTIDHVLADRRIGVRGVRVHPMPGSDHRAVFADLLLPPPSS